LVSKTKMTALVRAFAASDVDGGLRESPALLAVRDERGRNWLHLCCSVDVRGRARDVPRSLRTAEILLAHGIDIDEEAFTEDDWKATPLWFAIGRGRNLALAELLLERGCNPNYALWAASFNDDFAAIRLLVAHGADIEDPSVPDETPFLAAVKVSHFGSAEELLRLGADVNVRDPRGMTALHYMLKKKSDIAHFRMLIAHGARGDIPDNDGVTAVAILRKKRDPEFRTLADALA
jgi:ankyrin repeat protein